MARVGSVIAREQSSAHRENRDPSSVEGEVPGVEDSSELLS